MSFLRKVINVSIVPNAGHHAGILGVISIGTVTGLTVCAEQYEADDGAPVAYHMVRALDAVWSALPHVLHQRPDGTRYDFLIRQVAEGHAPADLYWSSGMSGAVLLGTVARKLAKVRHACSATLTPPRALEVTELPFSELSQFVPLPPAPRVNHVDHVRDTLRRLIRGENPLA